jgi:hypothetical protein
LVGLYPTNKLMRRGPVPVRRPKLSFLFSHVREQYIRY